MVVTITTEILHVFFLHDGGLLAPLRCSAPSNPQHIRTHCAQEQNIWMCCTINKTWASHAPPDNPLFKVKARHRNLEKRGGQGEERGRPLIMLGNYLNMSILRERNYHSSNSSKQVGNSAYFTGSAFPLGNLLAGNYRVRGSPSPLHPLHRRHRGEDQHLPVVCAGVHMGGPRWST